MVDEIQFSHLRYLINLHGEWTFFRECNNLLSFEVNKDSGVSVLGFRKALWKFYVIKHPVADAPPACSSLHSCRTALFLHMVSVHPLSLLCRLSHIAASDKMWSLLHADKEKIQILHPQLWAMDTAGAPEMDIKHVGNHLPHEDQQHQPPAQPDSHQQHVLQHLRLFSITEREPLVICYECSLEKDTRWQRKRLGPFSCHQMRKLIYVFIYGYYSILCWHQSNPTPIYCGKAQRTTSLGHARQVQDQTGMTLVWTIAGCVAIRETFPQRHILLALQEHAPTLSFPPAQWLFSSTITSQCLEGTIFPILAKWQILRQHGSVWVAIWEIKSGKAAHSKWY